MLNLKHSFNDTFMTKLVTFSKLTDEYPLPVFCLVLKLDFLVALLLSNL